MLPVKKNIILSCVLLSVSTFLPACGKHSVDGGGAALSSSSSSALVTNAGALDFPSQCSAGGGSLISSNNQQICMYYYGAASSISYTFNVQLQFFQTYQYYNSGISVNVGDTLKITNNGDALQGMVGGGFSFPINGGASASLMGQSGPVTLVVTIPAGISTSTGLRISSIQRLRCVNSSNQAFQCP